MYHGGNYRHSSNVDPFQLLLVFAVSIGSIFVIVIISIIIKSFIANKKSEREKKVINIAKRTGANYKPIFSKPVKDGATMECFICFNDPSYINVIEKADKENGVIYIGELEWVKPLSPHGNSRRSRNSYDYNAGARMGTDSNFDRIKHYNTMCVLYDNAFNLPNFDLTKETIDKKATEFLKMNETDDKSLVILERSNSVTKIIDAKYALLYLDHGDVNVDVYNNSSFSSEVSLANE